MKRSSPATLQVRLISLLEQNLAALERLTALLSRLESSQTPPSAQRTGMLSQADFCQLLNVTPDTLCRRIQRGTFPRPVWGKGSKALWRIEDVRGTGPGGIPR